jgi:hypothetical protein
MDQINYYKVLQVDPEAEAEVIKAAYRALSRKYHPDGSHPSAERMMRLNDAYAVLSDPPARSRHNDEIERRDFMAGRAPREPSAAPRMRYQENSAEPPKPRRRYRPYRVSVMTQIIFIGVCVLGLLASGLLRPFTGQPPSPTPNPTPTPPAYQVDAQALQADFEGNGFVFDTDYTRSGEPLKRGADTANVATVFIDDNSGSIRFASLLLTPRQDLATADQTEEDHALDVLLNATFGLAASQDIARSWIEDRITQARVDDSVVISGWSIRMWPASEEQTGIAIRPAVP